jgi:hypothetical protein
LEETRGRGEQRSGLGMTCIATTRTSTTALPPPATTACSCTVLITGDYY